ncbi:MAG: acyl carrier protein [Deltaproteobacteria bacterium]|nr:acyl carrier protein [Deltaproteobacteria bacterium]
MTDLEQKIMEILTSISNRNIGNVDETTRIAEDLGLKSASRIELAAVLEEHFKVSISNMDIRKPKTVGDVIGLVRSKL